jgi:hypothetical protein
VSAGSQATLAIALAVTGCESGPTCPADMTRVTLERGDGGREGDTRWHCERPDGTWHGPVVAVSGEGAEVVVGEWHEGKKHGRSLNVDPTGRIRIESSYHHGVLHGPGSMWIDGLPFAESSWYSGHPHARHQNFGLPLLRRDYLFGFPVGVAILSDARGTPETREYGGGGVLLRRNGRALPPPQASIELDDGTRLTRVDCAEQGLEADRCFALFEAYQECAALASRAETCRAAARVAHAQGPRIR